jgi:cytochrome P450 family 6
MIKGTLALNKKTDICDTLTKFCSALSLIDGDLFVAQALTFLLAGFETSSSTLSFGLYEIAVHPEVQQSLRAEILQVLRKHDGKLTYDIIQDMSYLDRVVSGEERREVKQ